MKWTSRWRKQQLEQRSATDSPKSQQDTSGKGLATTRPPPPPSTPERGAGQLRAIDVEKSKSPVSQEQPATRGQMKGAKQVGGLHDEEAEEEEDEYNLYA